MKLLKVHGKKVSVMLLAIAVMLVPILQVGAASECPEKKKIYLHTKRVCDIILSCYINIVNKYIKINVKKCKSNKNFYFCILNRNFSIVF